MSIYELHLGSWKKDYRLNEDGFINYRRLADELSEYVCYMGFTHVELMGICEYPFDGSWGYQVTGYFSPSSRYGTPEDLKYFINKMHECGIGVIIDWVPAHFPKDSWAMECFDGTALYESADPLLAEYPEWGTKAFDHSKAEVRSFLISSAFYWVREFHADALRVDAVAAMLYTNFSRDPWRPNKYGGSENLESIAFLKQLNHDLKRMTGAYLIAEDSSAIQGITKDETEGGMGFMFKWNMGWMNDSLSFFSKDAVYRKYHHDALTHTTDYVFSEYFVNVLSHDEVVHLKKSMFGKMPGDIPEKFSGLKCLYAYQFLHPGKKLLFMGQELAEEREWSEDTEINWAWASDPWHRDVMMCVRGLLMLYKKRPELYVDSLDPAALQWINRYDRDRGILSFIRRNVKDPRTGKQGGLLVVINTTPVMYNDYCCGAPEEFFRKEDCGASGNAAFGMTACAEYKVRRIFSTYDSLPTESMVSEDTPPFKALEEECDGMRFRINYGLRPYEAVVFEGV